MGYAGNERVTKDDINRAAEIYAQALTGAGITLPDGARLGWEAGSPTYGRCWRMHVTGETRADGTRCSGHSTPPVGGDHAARSAREFYESICHTASVIREVVYAMRKS